LAIEEFHYQIGDLAFCGTGDSEISDVDDIGMTQAAARLSLPLKSGEELRIGGPFGGDHLNGDDARGAEMRAEIDVSHAARTELAVDAILAVEDRANQAAIITTRGRQW